MPFKELPTPDQIKEQVEKLCDYMQGDLRKDLLRWLIDFKLASCYEEKPKPRCWKVIELFYQYNAEAKAEAKKEAGHKPPIRPASSLIGQSRDYPNEAKGKRLFEALDDALYAYYQKAGANDSIIISLRRGIGSGYEPQIKWRESSDDRDGGSVEVFQKWNSDKFTELIDALEPDEARENDLRVSTSFFVNWTATRYSLKELLFKGLRIELLFPFS